MSHFISHPLQPEGIMTVSPVQIIKGTRRATSRMEEEQLNRLFEKFSSKEKSTLNSSNCRSILVRCGNLKQKLHRYANSPQSIVQRALTPATEQEPLMRDITRLIVLDRKYQRPIRKRQNHMQDIVQTYQQKNRDAQLLRTLSQRQGTLQTLKMLTKSISGRVKTEPVAATQSSFGKRRF